MPPGTDTPELLAGILRSLRRGVLVQGEDGRVAAANPAYCAALGLDVPADELVDLPANVFDDALAPLLADIADFAARSREIMAAAQEISGELVRLGDGRVVARSYRAIDVGGARFHVWEVDDVTADVLRRERAETRREELEAQLRQQQKLEAIGVLASGVAHEINNPVQGVISYAELLRKRLGDDPRTGNMADKIIRECDRIATIVRNLLAFSRQEPSRRRAAKVCNIIDGTFSLIGTLLRRDGIHVTIDIEDGLPAVHCHDQHIQQVLMNLVTNARDALNERYPDASSEKQLAVRARRLASVSGDWVEILVEDRGMGIDHDVAERIFDPFFTTKDSDKGTGLGLSVSHGIVAEHGGELWMDAADGWTRFHVELPAAPAAPLPAPPE